MCNKPSPSSFDMKAQSSWREVQTAWWIDGLRN